MSRQNRLQITCCRVLAVLSRCSLVSWLSNCPRRFQGTRAKNQTSPKLLSVSTAGDYSKKGQYYLYLKDRTVKQIHVHYMAWFVRDKPQASFFRRPIELWPLG